MSLNVNNLTGGYSKKAIVRNINFDIARGEWLSLVGANGSGKSTLLKLISRILIPQKGRILLDGKAIHHQSAIEVAQKMALLPQQQIVPTGLTVYQLVGLGRNPHQNWWQWELDAQDRDKVESAIDAVGIEQFKNRPVERLSVESDKSFLAFSFSSNPQIFNLLDEPTTYLDLRYQLQLLELLKKLNLQQELTIITVLHELNLAARYSNRLAMLLNGQIWVDGDTDTVMNPENIRQVFGLETIVIDTPVGKQICALRAI
ncbi:MAG: ABC transporter ATP-binding protein [Nostocaceae cyanobacterium CSU_2_110]|nr:ABC transporter ATP-binding protein [Nostocaceae cyanobacterium CSU_2_110]